MRPHDRRQALWAELLLDALHAAGVRVVVLSPGSRSTPFVMAAEAHSGFDVHDVIDERVAAFFALGVGRATGRPALLLCTSGTAAAHYYPAVIEASASHVPLVVLTADRPTELHGCGANQTIDQARLFGVHSRYFADLGASSDEERPLRALRRTAAQAVFAALHPEPGAVHLNARAEKPLEPPLERSAEARLEDAALRARLGDVVTLHAPRILPSPAALDALESIARSGRGVILAGPAHVDQGAHRGLLYRLARALHAPILAEAGSQLRFGAPADAPIVGAADALLRSSYVAERLAPDYVLALGAAPVTGGPLALLERHRGKLAVVAPHGLPDPESRAACVVKAPIDATMEALLERFATKPLVPREGWLEAWARAERLAWDVAASTLGTDEALSEAAVVRTTVAATPKGHFFGVGNSLPIRQVDAWSPPSDSPLRVITQRGASGIDGMISAAAGAVVATRAPFTLLLGDLTFLHDASGLAVAARAPAPLTIVVVNNQGGRIFEQLPVAAHPSVYLQHFVTPHEVRIGDLCRAHAIPHAQVATRAELAAALEHAEARPGATVIEARVPPRGAAPLNRALFEAVDRRLREEGLG